MKSTLCNRIMLGVLMLGVTAPAATAINYHLVNTYKFEAAPGDREYFDYITFDSDSRRLYLSHGSEVLVVNADTGGEEGKISGLKVSHGVAVVPEVGRGFISDGAQGKAIIFSQDAEGSGRGEGCAGRRLHHLRPCVQACFHL